MRVDPPTFLPLSVQSTGDVTCLASRDGTVTRFSGNGIDFRPDCAHVLVEDCGGGNEKLRISAVWEECTGGTLQCIVSVVIDDSDIGRVLVTKDHHVYVNGKPTDFFPTVARPTGIKYKLIIVLDTCGVRMVGVKKGYDVCYNGSTSHVTVVLLTDSFVGRTCGLCGSSQRVERLIASDAGPTLSNLPNRPTRHGQTSTSTANETFKYKSWHCNGCNAHGPSNAVRIAQLTCGKSFNSKEFMTCKASLTRNEFNRLANRCQNRMCRCPNSHRQECLCKALSELAVACEKANVSVSWRNEGFCRKSNMHNKDRIRSY